MPTEALAKVGIVDGFWRAKDYAGSAFEVFKLVPRCRSHATRRRRGFQGGGVAPLGGTAKRRERAQRRAAP